MLSTLLGLGGVILWVAISPGWLALAALGAQQTSLLLLAWRWRAAALQWRKLAERTLIEGFSDALVKVNPGLLDLGMTETKPSEVLEEAIKETML